ncbi:hypothetical protein ACFPN4_10815 [Ureibacillus thermophilus]|uniref:hypothetical protein n=1 Tax=Ureibacillus TaxID=160795 RepID=UPI0031591A01
MTKRILDGRIISNSEEQNKMFQLLKETEEFKLLVAQLQEYQDFSVDDLEPVIALESDQLNFENKVTQVKAFTFKNKSKTVSLTYVRVDGSGISFETVKGKVVKDNVYKGFEIMQGEVREVFSKEYKGELDQQPILHNFPDNPDYKPGESVQGQALDWIDGKFCLDDEDNNKEYNHCGPGCGDGMSLGGGTPINDIDKCCRAHDRCWKNFGKGDKCCDKTLASCIDPYQDQDYYSWLQINTYFQPRGWLC